MVITFKNLASRPYNLHAIGVSYWKASEGEWGHGHTLRVPVLCLLLPGGGTSLPDPGVGSPRGLGGGGGISVSTVCWG